MRSLLLVLAFAALVQGCGLRGPLYLPTPEEEREQAARKARLEERQRIERSQPPDSDQVEPTQPAPAPPAPERPRPAETPDKPVPPIR
jgi:predicted small lipoprotein YifL